MVEKKLVLKLDADEVDKEKLEAVFGRSATYQVSIEVEKTDSLDFLKRRVRWILGIKF
jgi:hypothetical protein